MPQGLKGASASFSKLCQIIFRHIPNIITYVDDLVGATTTHLEMISLLNEVFAECRYHGMKLNLKKCLCGLDSLSWLGYNLSSNGISPERQRRSSQSHGFTNNHQRSSIAFRTITILQRLKSILTRGFSVMCQFLTNMTKVHTKNW